MKDLIAMDRQTVLHIIKMLNTRIDYYEQLSFMDDDQVGAQWALICFREHLQGGIEDRLNAEENKSTKP